MRRTSLRLNKIHRPGRADLLDRKTQASIRFRVRHSSKDEKPLKVLKVEEAFRKYKPHVPEIIDGMFALYEVIQSPDGSKPAGYR